jgi:HAD superfamily hydrolase (TIGR01509 family)
MGDAAPAGAPKTWGGVENPAALVFGARRAYTPPQSPRRRRRLIRRRCIASAAPLPTSALSLTSFAPPFHSHVPFSPVLVSDCDGTLVDTMGGFYEADLRTCEEVGMTMSKRQFYALAGVPIREIFRILAEEQGKSPDLDAMAARCKELADEIMAEGPALIEPVVAIAREAKRLGVPIAVASSGMRPTVTGHLRQRGVLDLFETVVTCEDVAKGKPAPDLYVLAAERLGVDPKRCVAYEDAELGMESARAAGMAVVDVRALDGYPTDDYKAE